MFINQHNGEEIGTAEKLLDPAPENAPLAEKARDFAFKTMKDWTEKDKQILQGMDVGEQATLLKLSIKYGDQLSKFAEQTGQLIDNKELKSIISPVLAHHSHREFVRFTDTLQKLTL